MNNGEDMSLKMSGNDLRAEISKIIKINGNGEDSLISLLKAIQEQYNYLPQEALKIVCELTDITPAQISGVVSFYPQFRVKPAGQHRIKVCIGTACHVKGAETIYNAFKKHLNIGSDEDTDAQRLFTVEKVACLGCCALAPVVAVDGKVHAAMTAKKVPIILSQYGGEKDRRKK